MCRSVKIIVCALKMFQQICRPRPEFNSEIPYAKYRVCEEEDVKLQTSVHPSLPPSPWPRSENASELLRGGRDGTTPTTQLNSNKQQNATSAISGSNFCHSRGTTDWDRSGGRISFDRLGEHIKPANSFYTRSEVREDQRGFWDRLNRID